MKKITLTLCILCASFSLKAQDNGYSADRPGLASTSFVVSEGKLLLESGLNTSKLTPDADATSSFGELFLRYGVLPRVEILGSLNSYVSNATVGEGFQNATVGLRINFFQIPAFNLPPEGSSRTDPYQETKLNVSLAGNLNIPTGNDEVDFDQYTGNIGVYADFDPEHPDFTKWSISSNLTFFVDDIDVNDDYLFTFTPTYNFDERHSIYFGYAGFYGSDNIDRYYLELGLFLKVRNLERMQVDLNSGYDLNNDGFFLGAGVAFALN